MFRLLMWPITAAVLGTVALFYLSFLFAGAVCVLTVQAIRALRRRRSA